jgi:hypothetical protein
MRQKFRILADPDPQHWIPTSRVGLVRRVEGVEGGPSPMGGPGAAPSSPGTLPAAHRYAIRQHSGSENKKHVFNQNAYLAEGSDYAKTITTQCNMNTIYIPGLIPVFISDLMIR